MSSVSLSAFNPPPPDRPPRYLCIMLKKWSDEIIQESLRLWRGAVGAWAHSMSVNKEWLCFHIYSGWSFGEALQCRPSDWTQKPEISQGLDVTCLLCTSTSAGHSWWDTRWPRLDLAGLLSAILEVLTLFHFPAWTTEPIYLDRKKTGTLFKQCFGFWFFKAEQSMLRYVLTGTAHSFTDKNKRPVSVGFFCNQPSSQLWLWDSQWLPNSDFMVGHRVWLRTLSAKHQEKKPKNRLTSQEILPVLRLLHRHGLVHGSFFTCGRRRGLEEMIMADSSFTRALVAWRRWCCGNYQRHQGAKVNRATLPHTWYIPSRPGWCWRSRVNV